MSRQERDLAAVARSILDSNLYMTLGTADREGRPWASPVYYAASGHGDFYWVSLPGAEHSRNLGARPQVGIVVFDTHAPIGTGQGVYMSALAQEVADADLAHGIEVFSSRSVEHGGRPWTEQDVRPPAFHRLYHATVTQHWVLDPDLRPGDQRTALNL
jgi:nitroimidazol reductase NimA-like FMN-containing flavoprotein (pyridoxamine 5'-phosphate oxidase superfamily)